MRKVAAGLDHSLLLKSDGTLYWANLLGRDYLGNTSIASTPNKLLSGVIDVHADHKL
ncbi:hypothetical protein [Pelagicoccus albus]|uniref:hypothetical protein n=1 Tax=Pelagicoccus albus TaxID=415222 RepID=UPI003CCD9BA4